MRHARQVRLREVGAAGQARLAASTVQISGDGLAAEIEARYLAGAGVPLLVESDAIAAAAREVDPALHVSTQTSAALRLCGPPPPDVRDPVARELVCGAHAALVAIRTILAVGPA